MAGKHPNQYTPGADDKSAKSKSNAKSKSSSSASGGVSAAVKEALHQYKMEAAREVGVSLNQGYNGDLTAKQAGSIGGQMVKKLIQKAEKSL